MTRTGQPSQQAYAMMKNRAGTKNPAAVMLTMTTVIFVVFREEYPGNGRIKGNYPACGGSQAFPA